MNRLQKTATAFMALTITLAGATFAIAPLALVDLHPAASHHAVSSLAHAATYAHSPVALQLRAMNIIYEATKERGSTVLIPSAMVDSFNVPGVLGLTSAMPTAPAVG